MNFAVGNVVGKLVTGYAVGLAEGHMVGVAVTSWVGMRVGDVVLWVGCAEGDMEVGELVPLHRRLQFGLVTTSLSFMERSLRMDCKWGLVATFSTSYFHVEEVAMTSPR